MAETAIKTKTNNHSFKHIEGAILIQLMLSNLRGTSVCNNVFENLLNLVTECLQRPGTQNCTPLKKHLLLVYLTAAIYNKQATLTYLQKSGLTHSLITELLAAKSLMKHSYEQKLFVIGFSEMLSYPDLPQELLQSLPTLIEQMVVTMLKLTEAEEKEKRKRANDEMNKMGDCEIDSDDYESENDEDDDSDSENSGEGSNDDGNEGVAKLGFVNPADDDDADDDEYEEVVVSLIRAMRVDCSLRRR